ncbi:MAG: gfo/Idh/MocA family oxidoreductase [Chloroflexi bacterium]|nr:MAG: gfo/Idh/MocA family oxidoreductase [Chloroflexota bacterium]
MQPVRLAVVGVGLIGVRHAELMRSHEGCALVGLCDVDPSRRAVADSFGVPFYSSVAELIERERPAGVVIATSNDTHAAVAEICARRSVDVLIEKPIASTLEQAHRIVDTAQESGIQVLVGHHRRHNPLIQKTRELLADGALGRLIGVSILWALLKPDDYFDVGWRREQPGGGPVLINLIHELDSLRFLCGEITEVYARTSSAVRGFAVEDSVSIALHFASGALGTLLASDATPAPWSYEATTGENPAYFRTHENCYTFLGTAASLAFPRMELWRYADGSRQGWKEPMERLAVEVAGADPLTRQLTHFCRVIRGEETPLIDAEDATKSLAVALAVQKSAHIELPVQPALVGGG